MIVIKHFRNLNVRIMSLWVVTGDCTCLNEFVWSSVSAAVKRKEILKKWEIKANNLSSLTSTHLSRNSHCIYRKFHRYIVVDIHNEYQSIHPHKDKIQLRLSPSYMSHHFDILSHNLEVLLDNFHKVSYQSHNVHRKILHRIQCMLDLIHWPNIFHVHDNNHDIDQFHNIDPYIASPNIDIGTFHSPHSKFHHDSIELNHTIHIYRQWNLADISISQWWYFWELDIDKCRRYGKHHAVKEERIIKSLNWKWSAFNSPHRHLLEFHSVLL